MATIKTYRGEQPPTLKYGELATSGDNLLLGKGEDKYLEFQASSVIKNEVEHEIIFHGFRIQLIDRIAYMHIYADTTYAEIQTVLDNLPKRPDNIDKYVFKVRGVVYFQQDINVVGFRIPVQFIGTYPTYISQQDWQILNPDLAVSLYYQQLLHNQYENKLIFGTNLNVKACLLVEFKELQITFSYPDNIYYLVKVDNSIITFNTVRLYFSAFNDLVFDGVLFLMENYSNLNFYYVELVPYSRKFIGCKDITDINFIDTIIDISTLSQGGMIHDLYRGGLNISLINKDESTSNVLVDSLLLNTQNRVNINMFSQV